WRFQGVELRRASGRGEPLGQGQAHRSEALLSERQPKAGAGRRSTDRGHRCARVLRHRQAQAGRDLPALPERAVLRFADPGRDPEGVCRGRAVGEGEPVHRGRAERRPTGAPSEREARQRGDVREGTTAEAALLGSGRTAPAGGGVLRGRLTQVWHAPTFTRGTSTEGDLSAGQTLSLALCARVQKRVSPASFSQSSGDSTSYSRHRAIRPPTSWTIATPWVRISYSKVYSPAPICFSSSKTRWCHCIFIGRGRPFSPRKNSKRAGRPRRTRGFGGEP